MKYAPDPISEIGSLSRKLSHEAKARTGSKNIYDIFFIDVNIRMLYSTRK